MKNAGTVSQTLEQIGWQVPAETIRTWKPEQKRKVYEWAQATLQAQQGRDIKAPQRPAILKPYAPKPARRPGRPPKLNVYGEMEDCTVRLPADQKAFCIELGEGSLQEGVRRAINLAMEGKGE